MGSVDAVHALCEVLDELRRDRPVALVVDPVLAASAGGPAAIFANASLLRAYREQLLPRAQLITPNRREAELLLDLADHEQSRQWMAAGLLALGAEAVCITGGDDSDTLALDWLHSPQARGHLALPRLPQRHHHGSGCTFASAAAAALARGFVTADAVVLAKMATWVAVRDGHAAGAGAGAVRASGSFLFEPEAMPVLSFDAEPIDAETLARWQQVLRPPANPPANLGLYAITDKPHRVSELAAAGISQIQLRIKTAASNGIDAGLAGDVRRALHAMGERSGCQLWINDHWRLALQEPGVGLHLGQEDWLALAAEERSRVLNSGIKLGLSSHSLWELARARGLNPHYIACGPIWPTSTKDMPWRPQGLGNLAWWVSMAGRPVVAIGGLLEAEQVRACATTGAAAACLVRALDRPAASIAEFSEAWQLGRSAARSPLHPPTPSLGPAAGKPG